MKYLKNKFKSFFIDALGENLLPKSPIIVGVILIYIATVFIQNPDKLSLHEIVGFTIVMIVQLLVYLFSETVFKNKYWLYFIIQGIITFDYAIIEPNGYKTILIGMVPLFVIQSMIIYSDTIKVIVTAIFFYGIFFGTIIVISGIEELIRSVPLLIIITIAMRAYSLFFFKQVKLRIQTQKLLQELELAYERVEELTLTNERQRMARDLHDTLSQGLAGVIMQLEAVSANLKNDNTKRAQEIVQKAMEHSRRTLSDSRVLIDNLRSHTKAEMDLSKEIEREILNFKNISGTLISENISIKSTIPINLSKHILFIVREALNNIAKHSDAKNAYIEVIENQNKIDINIKDDGIGFDVGRLEKQFGHYGILGMTERVKAVKGNIKIKSKRKAGTNINIIIPIEKGIDKEDE